MRVKICGLRSRGDVAAAASSGATYGGLVFFHQSPRNLSLADARWIAQAMPDGLVKVALTVDAEDRDLAAILQAIPVDMLQLHGHESPERVEEVRRLFGLPVMKAIGVAEEADVLSIEDYASVADMLLIDARPPKDSALPGGNGLKFDWRIIEGRNWPVPWMLAGGLTPENVGDAIRLTGAQQVDVSSGVESSLGIKSPLLIREFVRAASV